MNKIALRAAAAVGLGIAGNAVAFDAGPHNDLTISAMRDEGFSVDAQNVTALDDNLVDYYTSQPAYPGLNEELDYAHFDYRAAEGVALPTPFDHVKNYWARLSYNTKEYVQAEAAGNDSDKARNILHVIGYTLHTLQDFYAHSTWVENLPANLKGPGFMPTATYFDIPEAQLSRDLRTGKYPNTKPEPLPTDHGETGIGINHDFATRPNHLLAYSTAYAASRQWIRGIGEWVKASGPQGPALWAQIRATMLDDADRGHVLAQLAAYRDLGNYLGHWNGPESKRSLKFAAAFATMAATADSSCTLAIRTHLYNKILKQNVDSLGRRTGTPDPHMVGGGPLTDATAPTLAKIDLPVRMVLVRTTAVNSAFTTAEKLSTFVGIDAGYDEHSVVTIDGHPYVSPSSAGEGTFSPSWTAVDFVPATQSNVDIGYAMVQYGGTECHVNPYGPKDLHFQFSPRDNRCIGPTVLGATLDQPFTANGQGYSAAPFNDHKVNSTFYVTSTPLGSALPLPGAATPPAPLVDYSTSIHTGTPLGAGTDSNITVTLQGTKGALGPYTVNPWISGNAFENNSTDSLFFQQFPDIGTISSITVTSDDRYPASDWYLDWFKVQPSNGPLEYFGYRNWIKAGNLTARLSPSAAPTDYTVTVHTGDKIGAGTDSNITLTINGSRGSTPGVTLNPLISGNAFERNNTDTAQLKDLADVGDIQSIVISSDDKYAGSAWYLGWIEVRSASGSVKRFNYNNWVQDGNLRITLSG